MWSVPVAVLSSILYGLADFLGGATSKRLHVLQVAAIAAPASLLIEVVLIPLLGASWSSGVLFWGGLSGLCSAAAFTFLYLALARGPMAILSPVTAVVSAVIPVAVGFVIAAVFPGWTKVAGLVVAVPAIVLLSLGSSADEQVRPRVSSLMIAVGAGAAIGTQLVFLHAAPADSGVAPLIVGRAVASLVLGIAAATVLPRVGPGRPSWRLGAIAAVAGMLDSLANVAFVISSRLGDLAVSGMIVALYPATTVLLAAIVFHERLGWRAVLGLVLSLVGVALLALP